MTISDIREKVKEIQKEVIKYDSKSKAGNQNCLLCAWVVEAYFRGVDILPRPVYSPRDIIFKKNGYDIIKDPIKIQIKNKNDVIRIIKNAGDESRFYIHVKWSASTQGGHEFNLINLNSKIYLIDGQAGLVCLINSKSAITYFDGIDFSNSYMVRLDDKEFNQSILKYNKMKYLIMWDDSKDIPYITKHDLASESALSFKSIHERVNDMGTTSFDIVMERAFDDKMNERMTTAFQKGKEAGNSNYMRTANTCLNEARRLLKQGDIREAKAKYKESLDNILAAIQIVTESYNDLEHSGEGKKRIGFKQFSIIASFIAYIIIICITGSKIATSDMSPSSTAISTAAGVGGSTAGYLGILNIIKNWKNKDDKINYDKFKSQFQDDPKSTLRVVLKSLNQTYNQIHREMIRECK